MVFFCTADDEFSPSEPKRSLRRERKLNPRYASSEYTSIFNSRKETFITKQSVVSSVVRNQTSSSSPNAESKYKKKELVAEKNKVQKKSSNESFDFKSRDHDIKCSNTENAVAVSESHVQEDQSDDSDDSDISSSDEIESIMDKEPLSQEADNKHKNKSGCNPLKARLKVKLQNNSKLNINSYSVKRKHKMNDMPASKRPCSRSSVDSSCSDFTTNENKPFNSEKQNLHDEKLLKVHSELKGSDLTEGIKKDLFCKQRTSNNGDILGQKEILLKNSHGKTLGASEKKTDSETR